MTDILSVAPILCGGVLAACIMYTAKNSRLRDKQGKFLGLMIVILAVGVLIILSGYHGLLSNPFAGESSINQGNMALKVTPSVAHVNGKLSTEHTEMKAANRVITAVQEYIYGIMFDAGSTGSRIHVFKFKQTDPDKPFEFIEELFEKVQPGLSSYADHPKQAADSLRGMLDKAKNFIPSDQWLSTPIALKATAGLRKLKAEEADNILNEVRQLFVEYPFRQEDDSVVIMEGTDEGVFSWFTVNFYAGVLGDSTKMAGVMDLGGGSTQITFTPNDPETLSSAPSEYILDKSILGKPTKLYTHSYLDLGLMAGRLQTMGGNVGVDRPEGQPLPELTSACFPDGYNGKITFGQDEYTIKGLDVSGSRYDTCHGAAEKVVAGYNIHSVKEIQNKAFCTISYYFDRAVEASLVDEEKGGKVKVGQFIEAAKKVCSKPSTDEPFLCMDLCYISALLEDGFKISHSVSLDVEKTINGQEISWALGAMFDFFSSHKHRPDKGTECEKVTFLADSIGRYIELPGLRTVFSPGAKVEHLQRMLVENKVNITTKYLIVLVGTNNIADGEAGQDIWLEYTELIGAIRRKYPKIVIFACGLLPRDRDYDLTRTSWIQFGDSLKSHLGVLKLHHIDLSSPFLRSKRPNSELFKQRYSQGYIDGIHPNKNGQKVIKNALNTAVASELGDEWSKDCRQSSIIEVDRTSMETVFTS